MPRDGTEIVAEMPRRKRAIPLSNPIVLPPASEPIVDDVGGHAATEIHSMCAADIVNDLVALQRKRRFCIVSQSRIDRSIESLIASTLGFRIDADEKDRKKVFAQAKALRLDVEKGAGSTAPTTLAPLILTSAATRAQWDTLRAEAEKEMRRLATQLPVYAFAKGVKGFGDLGLAVICAEAGIPLGDYRTVSGLWKRMGLAVINGERQRRKTDRAAAAEHGYSPMRRAEVWSICSDSMFRHQWRAATDEQAGGPKGPYGEVYARRRLRTDPRIEATADLPAGDPAKWTKGRCHNDARRIMTKELLKDLWVEWRKASAG